MKTKKAVKFFLISGLVLLFSLVAIFLITVVLHLLKIDTTFVNNIYILVDSIFKLDILLFFGMSILEYSDKINYFCEDKDKEDEKDN